MGITERQEEILAAIVREYIESAEPVGSTRLAKKHDFGITAPAVRIEMQELSRNGYLVQPHTSAGRVPTDRAYVFFVDNLLKEPLLDETETIEGWIEKEIQNTLSFIRELTKKLSLASSAFALSYVPKEGILWKEGWEEIIEEPEFEEAKCVADFASLIRRIEETIDEIEWPESVQTYIGKKNLIPGASDFSTIIGTFSLPDSTKGLLALVGPKRMDYHKNINLLKSLTKLYG